MSLRQRLSELSAGPPPIWPHFSSTLRSVAVTARIGRVLGFCFAICFVTGMISHYQYHPSSALPIPATPSWGYRVTQGLHVMTGIATIPLLLVKLWSVFPKLFRWPLMRDPLHALERLSIAVLVSSALVELATGFMNAMDWYAFNWPFVPVHRFLGYVAAGSILLHIAVKLPDIRRGLGTPLATAPTLDEADEVDDAAEVDHIARDAAATATPALSRRGLLLAAGAGIGVVVATSVGETLTPLEPIGLLAIRQGDKGPQGLPVNRTARQAGVRRVGTDYVLHVDGPRPFTLSLREIEIMARHEADLPIACVEGWSRGANWRGLMLLDIVKRAGGDSGSRIRVASMQRRGSFGHSVIEGPQLQHALLATHLNTERLNLDHGYPLRLIAPDRAGVLNTKWLHTVQVLS